MSRPTRVALDRLSARPSSTLTIVGGPLPGLARQLGRPELGLADELERAPSTTPGADSTARRPTSESPSRGKRDALVVSAGPEREHVERLERVERVRPAAGQVDDAVAGADLGRLARSATTSPSPDST